VPKFHSGVSSVARVMNGRKLINDQRSTINDQRSTNNDQRPRVLEAFSAARLRDE
jgi:hypothetical protein